MLAETVGAGVGIKLKILAAREGVSLNAFVTSVLAEPVGKKTAK